MLVPVAIVCRVTVTVVDVIHVIAVRNCNVTTVGAMLVVVIVVGVVLSRLALVPVAIVVAVQVTVVDVVNVVAVRHRYVAAVWAVLVVVAFVSFAGHCCLLFRRGAV
ncbi:hypothetical protein MA47_05810 [Corynebacterium auriscanis]|uniref:Uncharacterized protein n=1 Tax=Corynebacterium auriscanis TaxID=99807 RepID=A0A0A2DHM0_9CORY|nr:hypothetical protein MA47_05810 [Corynebacterium auriscanis]